MFENLFKTPEKDRKKKMLELAMQAGIPITNLFTEESPIAETGRLMQKFDLPDVEVPGPIKGGFPITQVPGILESMIRSYGETFERTFTRKGRKELLESAKKIFRKPLKLENIKEPAVQAALDLPDFLPGGFLFAGGIKAISKAGVKEAGEKAVKEGIEKTVKSSVQPISRTLAKDLKQGIRQAEPIEKIAKSMPIEEIRKIPISQQKLPLSDIPSSSSISDPVNKIINAIKKAKPIRHAQEKLYSVERGKRFAQAQEVGEVIKGEKGYYAELSKLKGELPKVQFESLRGSLEQMDIDNLFIKISDHPYLNYGEKLHAREGLAKLLGVKGSTVPTKGELRLLKEVYGEEFTKIILDKRSLFQKIWETTGETLSLPRSLMAGGLDMSYGLRQGVFGLYRYPKQWFSSFKEQFKWFLHEDALKASTQEIRSRPTYQLMSENKLALTDLDRYLSIREEQFFSPLAEKIPVIGKFVRASSRAYVGFANKFRADVFDDLVKIGKNTEAIDDPTYLAKAADFVNTLTGRGSLGQAEKAAGTLSTALFSPRLLISRFQLLNPLYYANLHPVVRKEALKTLFSFVAGSGTILGLSKLAGADVGTDPTNADFAKIKIGNTRIDILGGFQQPIVLAARLITNKVTSSTTGKEMTLGEGYKPLTRADIVARFFESKEAPIISFLHSLLKGQTPIGEPVEVKKEIIKRITPMFIQDMIELYKEGELSNLMMGVPAFFGAGVQTYGPKSIKSNLPGFKNIRQFKISNKDFGEIKGFKKPKTFEGLFK